MASLPPLWNHPCCTAHKKYVLSSSVVWNLSNYLFIMLSVVMEVDGTDNHGFTYACFEFISLILDLSHSIRFAQVFLYVGTARWFSEVLLLFFNLFYVCFIEGTHFRTTVPL